MHAELELLRSAIRRCTVAPMAARFAPGAACVTELPKKKEASLADLRELLCPATTERTEKVLKQAGIDSGPEKPSTGPEV